MSDADANSNAITYTLWYYKPSLAAGVVAAAFFFILSIVHLVRIIQKRTWSCLPLVIGGICMSLRPPASAEYFDSC